MLLALWDLMQIFEIGKEKKKLHAIWKFKGREIF